MNKTEEVLSVLRRLRKKYGRVLPLNLIFETLIKEGVYGSKKAIADCLHRLQMARKIKPVNFGVNIELLEDAVVEYTQSSLAGFRRD